MAQAVVTGIVAVIVCIINNLFQLDKIKKVSKKAARDENEATKLGIQALLRDRLYHLYNKCSEQGYAPIYSRENFNNMYEQYHKLGANGVMDNLKEMFEALPTEPKEE